jgi:hypothetical protein
MSIQDPITKAGLASVKTGIASEPAEVKPEAAETPLKIDVAAENEEAPFHTRRWQERLSDYASVLPPALVKSRIILRLIWRYLGLAFRHIAAKLQRYIASFSTKAPASNRYRYLARQIALDLAHVETYRTVVFSSNESLQVNSEILMMFAYLLHDELGCKVLMIDGTFRDEGLTEAFGHVGATGFMNLLYEDELDSQSLVIPAVKDSIYVLPSGYEANNGFSPIDEGRIQGVLDEVGQNVDYVLIQQGSINLDSRYLLFKEHSDLVLWHVAEGSTRLDEFQSCQKTFKDHHVENVRMILSE